MRRLHLGGRAALAGLLAASAWLLLGGGRSDRAVLQLDLHGGVASIRVDGRPRLQRALPSPAGAWVARLGFEASEPAVGQAPAEADGASLQDAGGRHDWPGFRVGRLPQVLQPPCRLSLALQRSRGVRLSWRDPATGAGQRLLFDPAGNQLGFYERGPGDCTWNTVSYEALRPVAMGPALAALARDVAALLAVMLLGLSVLLGAARVLAGARQEGRALAVPGPAVWAALALVLALTLCLGPMQRLPKSCDDVALLFQARIEANGRLAAPAPPLPVFFSAEGLRVGLRGWSGKQPVLWAWVLGQALKVRLAWLVNPLLAAATVLLLAGLARALGGPQEAALAALLLAVSPFLLEMSASFLVMTPALALALGFAWALWILDRAKAGSTGRAWVAVALTLLGLAWTRPYTGLCLLAGGGAWLAAGRRRPREWVAGLATCAALLALSLAAQNWLATGRPLVSAYAAYDPRDRLGFGPGVGLFWTWGSPGYTPAKALMNLDLYLRLFAGALEGWPWWVGLAPALLLPLLRRPNRGDTLLMALAGAQATGYLLYYSADTLHGPRYWFEILGPAVLLTARGLGALLARTRSLGGAAGRWPVVAVLAVLFGTGLFLQLPAQALGLRSANHVDGRLARAVRSLPPGPVLVFFASEDRSRYLEPFSLQDPFLRAPVIFARDQGAAEDRALRDQFPGRTPYFWDGRVLSLIRWRGCAEAP